jgi:two-component system, OmpR family, sensor histidine kinase ChvG
MRSISKHPLFLELFRIRYRLLLINVFIVAVPLLGIGFARFYEREMLRGLEDDMIHQGQILREALLDDPTGTRLSERSSMLAKAARDTRTRIRLLGPNGELLSDSHFKGPPEGPEKSPPHFLSRELPPQSQPSTRQVLDVSSRGEVRRALKGKYGAATRTWENQELVYLFSAVPIQEDDTVLGVVYVTRSTIPVQVAMYTLRTTLFWLLGLSVFATAILTLFLAATISRPLSQLTQIAQRIAKTGRREPVSIQRRDEIGQLARAFDGMAEKLEGGARYVRDLSADISHEFKSPLTSIRGATELLLDGAMDDPTARERFLQNILADSKRLDRLVSRLLELSRVEADSAPEESLDYRELLQQIATRYPHCKLQYEAKESHLIARRQHLSSVLVNLLDNAQSHATPETTITITVSQAPGAMKTSIHNYGTVISATNSNKIWQRFFTTRAQQGGSGLGLNIVATIVKAHGGEVSAESSAEHGTTFSFTLLN